MEFSSHQHLRNLVVYDGLHCCCLCCACSIRFFALVACCCLSIGTARYRPRATTLHTPNSLKFKLPYRADFLPQPISSARLAVLPCCVAFSSVCCFPELFAHFKSHSLSLSCSNNLRYSHRRRPIPRTKLSGTFRPYDFASHLRAVETHGCGVSGGGEIIVNIA